MTEVDKTAEPIIADVLRTGGPPGRFVGEELSPEVVRGGLVWIVDPLDGTTNFLHDYPSYAVIAAAVDGCCKRERETPASMDGASLPCEPRINHQRKR